MSTVLVTGANRGIGLELVRLLLERGDTVFAACRDPDRAADLQALAQSSLALTVLAIDVTDPASISAAVAQVDGAPLDILINNAGIIGPKRQSSTDMDFDGWLETFSVNTLGPLRVLQAFLPNLSLRDQAYVLTVTSRMGSLTASPGTDRIAYRSSKAALNRAMQAVAGDLKMRNIAVSVAHPGWVRTDMGGSSADIRPADSAAGLLHVIDRMTISKSPRFFNYDGSDISW
jgi:NAD(P)-dependent dehydrogenase (short-subunit alcohol dehydrogenase family)